MHIVLTIISLYYKFMLIICYRELPVLINLIPHYNVPLEYLNVTKKTTYKIKIIYISIIIIKIL